MNASNNGASEERKARKADKRRLKRERQEKNRKTKGAVVTNFDPSKQAADDVDAKNALEVRDTTPVRVEPGLQAYKRPIIMTLYKSIDVEIPAVASSEKEMIMKLDEAYGDVARLRKRRNELEDELEAKNSSSSSCSVVDGKSSGPNPNLLKSLGKAPQMLTRKVEELRLWKQKVELWSSPLTTPQDLQAAAGILLLAQTDDVQRYLLRKKGEKPSSVSGVFEMSSNDMRDDEKQSAFSAR